LRGIVARAQSPAEYRNRKESLRIENEPSPLTVPCCEVTYGVRKLDAVMCRTANEIDGRRSGIHVSGEDELVSVAYEPACERAFQCAVHNADVNMERADVTILFDVPSTMELLKRKDVKPVIAAGADRLGGFWPGRFLDEIDCIAN